MHLLPAGIATPNGVHEAVITAIAHAGVTVLLANSIVTRLLPALYITLRH